MYSKRSNGTVNVFLGEQATWILKAKEEWLRKQASRKQEAKAGETLNKWMGKQ